MQKQQTKKKTTKNYTCSCDVLFTYIFVIFGIDYVYIGERTVDYDTIKYT